MTSYEKKDRARDLLLEVCSDHEADCPNGPECAFPIGLAAWIAHCLGVKSPSAINLMESELDKYKAECPLGRAAARGRGIESLVTPSQKE